MHWQRAASLILVIKPRQHEKLTWRGVDLSDMTYKVYEQKNTLKVDGSN